MQHTSKALFIVDIPFLTTGPLRPPPQVVKASKMLIKVMALTGKVIEIEIEPTDKVGRIKEIVQEAEGIPPEQMRLIFLGKQMEDEKTAADYKVQDGSVIHLVLRLRG